MITRVILFFILIVGLSGCFDEAPEADFITLAPGPFRAAYLVPEATAVRTRVELIVQAGEVDNTGPEGLAHYVEHLAWLPQLDPSLRSSRQSNAFTSNLATSYVITGPPEDLPSNIDRLMTALAPFSLSPEFMREEIDIVRREYERAVLENPYYPLYVQMQDALLGSSPLARMPLGTPQTMDAFTLDAAAAFHARTHRAENAVLLVKGTAAPEEIEALLAALPAAAAPRAPDPLPPRDDTPAALHLDWDAGTLAGNELHYRKIIPAGAEMSDAALEAAASVLLRAIDSPMAGGIAAPLRFDNFYAREFFVDIWRRGNSHLELEFQAKPDGGITLEFLVQAFEEALAGDSLPKDTFETAKARELESLTSLERPGFATFELLQSQIENRRPPFGLSELIAATEALSWEEANRLYLALSSEGRRVTGFVTKR